MAAGRGGHQMDEALTKIREAAVADLRGHWGAAYEIWFEAGQYCAMRRDNGAIVRCGGADGLRREMERTMRPGRYVAEALAGRARVGRASPELAWLWGAWPRVAWPVARYHGTARLWAAR